MMGGQRGEGGIYIEGIGHGASPCGASPHPYQASTTPTPLRLPSRTASRPLGALPRTSSPALPCVSPPHLLFPPCAHARQQVETILKKNRSVLTSVGIGHDFHNLYEDRKPSLSREGSTPLRTFLLSWNNLSSAPERRPGARPRGLRPEKRAASPPPSASAPRHSGSPLSPSSDPSHLLSVLLASAPPPFSPFSPRPAKEPPRSKPPPPPPPPLPLSLLVPARARPPPFPHPSRSCANRPP